MSSFDAFDTDMKVGTRQRREKDEFKVYQMKQQMAQLERQLNSEIKRRSEMHKSMRTWCDARIAPRPHGLVHLRPSFDLRVQLALELGHLLLHLVDLEFVLLAPLARPDLHVGVERVEARH